jgi:hypothetical protein
MAVADIVVVGKAAVGTVAEKAVPDTAVADRLFADMAATEEHRRCYKVTEQAEAILGLLQAERLGRHAPPLRRVQLDRAMAPVGWPSEPGGRPSVGSNFRRG